MHRKRDRPQEVQRGGRARVQPQPGARVLHGGAVQRGAQRQGTPQGGFVPPPD